jgi:hypothetical protein
MIPMLRVRASGNSRIGRASAMVVVLFGRRLLG